MTRRTLSRWAAVVVAAAVVVWLVSAFAPDLAAEARAFLRELIRAL
ncbi:hypothetical protein AAG589_03895 [Isoptericola sp. F-RaC21]